MTTEPEKKANGKDDELVFAVEEEGDKTGGSDFWKVMIVDD